jgi:hypothetical protein
MMSIYVRTIRKLGNSVINVGDFYFEIREILLRRVGRLMDLLLVVRDVIGI